MIIPKNKQSKRRNETRSKFTASGTVPGSILLSMGLMGLMLLAFSCAPASIGGELVAPGAVVDLGIDKASVDSTSLMVQWAVPTETVTKPDGTAVSPDEIVYRVYYLAETTGRTTGQTTGRTVPSAESIKQNPDTKTQDVSGVSYVRLVNLEPGTRYFITIDSGYATRSVSEAAEEPGLGAASWRLGRATSRAVAVGRSGESELSFNGYLSYAQLEYRYLSGFSIQTIEPTKRPTVPSSPFTGRNVPITYSLEKIGDTNFDPISAIDEDSGVVTVNSTTDKGVASYHIRAEAEGYNAQTETLTIIVNELLQVTTYYDSGTTTRAAPVEIGQATADRGIFSLEDTDIVLTIPNLANGAYEIHFGSEEGNYNKGSYSKTIRNGSLKIRKSELSAHSFPFLDGAVIGILGLGVTRTQHVATYVPSNIYSYRDLQAMRIDLDRDYILKNDIDFPNTGVANYEAVGRDKDFPFTGSLNGENYSIVGIEINAPYSNYQGLFGVMEAASVDDVVVQNLVLRDFIIFGKFAVGSLAGQLERGTVDNVHVEVSTPSAGKVEVDGSGYGGGLIGSVAGEDSSGIQVKILNASSTVAVTGASFGSSYLGGLVGGVNEDALLTGSYATGDVTGDAYVGGLAGVSYGTVTESYATGDVTGNSLIGGLLGSNTGDVTASYATGDVTGTGDNIGGLVSANTGTVEGYATGDVTGGQGVGGLVSHNRGTVTGYATGNVTGTGDTVGGLVSYNAGTVRGYVTGNVTGSDKVGGLVGSNNGSDSQNSTVTGYAIGEVKGVSNAGGLVGYNAEYGIVTGYARSVVRRSSGSDLSFGRTVGNNGGTQETYSSNNNIVSGSKLYDGNTGRFVLVDTTGEDGISVLVDDRATQAAFSMLSFGANLGQWTWVADGKWPAINIGDDIKAVEEQSLDSCVRSSSLEQCFVALKLEASTYHSGYSSLPVKLGQAIADNESAAFALADDAVVLAVVGLFDGDYTIHLGPAEDDYSGTSYLKASGNGIMEILKSELITSTKSLGDGFVIGMSGRSIPNIQHVATYVPSKIHNRYDLQAMRNDLTRSYVLTKNIEFPSVNESASNYEKVGTDRFAFAGSLNGAGYTISGIQIKSVFAYQGIFGLVRAATTNAVIAQNLVLRDFKIATDAFVGSLAGGIERGIVNGVNVEMSAPGTGYVTSSGRYVGGLAGYTRGAVIDSHATGAVTGAGDVGGLVGSSFGPVSGSHATGAVTATGGVAGGLLGYNNGPVSGSYATGAVTAGSNYVGGLIGSNGVSTVSTSYATGSVTGAQRVGGLVGFNEGTVTTSHATGSVTGNDSVGGLVGWSKDTVTASYATGLVTGDGSYAGGLVGYGSGTVSGYATGAVTGDIYTGGLVGHMIGYSSSDSRTIGYATGDVTGNDYVGGLLGFNDRGTAIGYALGLVKGNDYIGGLVGDSNSRGTVSGYAGGNVIGNDYIGGLVGGNAGTVSGYARGIVRRASRRATTFGKTIGADTGTSTTYNSIVESRVYNGSTGTTVLTGRGDGTSDGIEVIVSNTTTQAVFSELVFGTDLGEWTWVADGMWAAINIGDEIKPANEQSVEPCIFAEFLEQCQIEADLEASTYYSTAMSSLPIGLGQAIVDDSNNAFALADDTVIFAIPNLTDGEYSIHFGFRRDNYDVTNNPSSVTVSGGTLEIRKSDVTASSFSFTDGAIIGISGPSFTSIYHVATYRPSNIHNYHDLQGIREDLFQDYVLKNDIEFPPVNAGASNYEAIGNNLNPFKGSLDGAGYTISGMQIEASSSDYQGLFGAIEASEVDAVIVQNLVLSNFKINGKNNVGSLVGRVKRGRVNSVHVEVLAPGTGYVIGSADNIGGLVGHNDNDGTVTGHATGDVTGTGSSVGGLVGLNEGTVTESYAIGSVTGNSYSVGGLVGTNANAGAVTGYATGDVSGMRNNVGGLVGNNRNVSGTVSGYATGSVTGTDSSTRVGGLVGNNAGTVSGYATGSVTGENASFVGGLVGFNSVGTVTGHAIGSVTGSSLVGGLVGRNGNAGTVTGHATGDVTGDDSVGGLIGWTRGTVTESYATGSTTGTGDSTGGLVGYNDGTVTESYATGSTTGAGDNTGGLVGYSDDDGMVTESYATGNVAGTGNRVGGLVGHNRSTVSGYATGSVEGAMDVGGFAGYNVGIITGYATGSVAGTINAGGLVGNNRYITTGYATGPVIGRSSTGGLVGLNYIDSIVTGYARGVVRRADGSVSNNFGKTIGENQGREKTFSSSNSVVPESEIYAGTTGTIAFTSTTGVDGTAVDVSVPVTKNLFNSLNFNILRIGRWIWIDGKWPAVYIGNVKPASEQPIDLSVQPTGL